MYIVSLFVLIIAERIEPENSIPHEDNHSHLQYAHPRHDLGISQRFRFPVLGVVALFTCLLTIFMGKDPAFLFYPGDYLKDTQCLSEKSQVAYDRIMCEHMRNMCISQDKLNFFTKRLSDDEKSELRHVLEKNSDGTFKIPWVAESIEKRREYSQSRSKNRLGKSTKPKRKKTSSSYDEHMENENEDVNGVRKGKQKIEFKPPDPNEVAEYMAEINYPAVVQEEAEMFVNFYSSKGWMIGKNKMKDWKASVRTWKQKKNDSQQQQKQTGSSAAGNDRLAISLAAIRERSNMGQG